MFAVVLLLLVPELRHNKILPWQLFTSVEKKQQLLKQRDLLEHHNQ